MAFKLNQQEKELEMKEPAKMSKSAKRKKVSLVSRPSQVLDMLNLFRGKVFKMTQFDTLFLKSILMKAVEPSPVFSTKQFARLKELKRVYIDKKIYRGLDEDITTQDLIDNTQRSWTFEASS